MLAYTSLAPSLLPRVPSAQLARRRRPPRRRDLEPATHQTLGLVPVFAQTQKSTKKCTHAQRERGRGYQFETRQKRSGRGGSDLRLGVRRNPRPEAARQASATRFPEPPPAQPTPTATRRLPEQGLHAGGAAARTDGRAGPARRRSDAAAARRHGSAPRAGPPHRRRLPSGRGLWLCGHRPRRGGTAGAAGQSARLRRRHGLTLKLMMSEARERAASRVLLCGFGGGRGAVPAHARVFPRVGLPGCE
jgi:hypothetical protein